MTSLKQPPSSTTGPATRPSLDATFSYGFRPFFLGAGVYAAILMSAWIAWIVSSRSGGSADWLMIAGSPFAWHAHEMVYGFAAAAIAGFLLTAVPNWTGGLPLSGLPLACLFAVWLAGRIVACCSGLIPYPVYMAVDLLFLPLLAVFAARQLFIRPAARNLVFLLIIAALTACNITFHLANAGYIARNPAAPVRVGLLVVVVMIAIIGGRIIPAFTHNWLHLHRPLERRPWRSLWLDRIAVATLVLFVVLTSMDANPKALGSVAAVAALANGLRLAFWRGLAARSEPILWILHIGYAWIAIALTLAAFSAFTARIPAGVVIHAFGAGAVGTMILGVMSRASLGHTGRRLVAPPLAVWCYYLVSGAALLRVTAPFLQAQAYDTAISLAGLTWIGAFALFLIVYTPILITPRVHTKVSIS